MADNNFEFGYTGDFTNVTFTEIREETSGDFDFGLGVLIFPILFGTNNAFNSIWVDATSSLNSGRLYVGRPEDLTIIKYSNDQAFIEDYYSKTFEGETKETLKAEDSVDINVTY
jgi:hypothetical protein